MFEKFDIPCLLQDSKLCCGNCLDCEFKVVFLHPDDPLEAVKVPNKKNDRYKNWLFLVYQDEAYPDWFKRIKNTGVKCAISPLHEADVWSEDDQMIENPRVGNSPDLRDYNKRIKQEYVDGKPKKPHWHVVAQFPGSQSQDQVNEFAVECFQADPPKPFRCKSISGSTRYLIHYDDPQKEQYHISAITAYNGFDVDKWFEPSVAQEDKLFYDVRLICKREDFKSFFQLMDFLSDQSQQGDYVEEFRYCRRHVNLIKAYVDGRGRYDNAVKADNRSRDQIEAIKDISEIIRKVYDPT